MSDIVLHIRPFGLCFLPLIVMTENKKKCPHGNSLHLRSDQLNIRKQYPFAMLLSLNVPMRASVHEMVESWEVLYTAIKPQRLTESKQQRHQAVLPICNELHI